MFKLVSTLTENEPVKKEGIPSLNSTTEVVSACNYDDELSSTKGVYSKNLYIARIDPFTCELSPPCLLIEGDDLIHIDNKVEGSEK